MAVQSNNAEGGVNGALPTISDTGSGDAFTVVAKASDAVLEYTNVAVGHGGMAYRAATRTTSSTAYFEMTATLAATNYGRQVFMVDDHSTGVSASRISQFRSSAAGTILGALFLSSTGTTLQIRDGASVNKYDFTNKLTFGSWYRIEWQVTVNNTSTAQIQARLYNRDSASLIEDSGLVSSPINGAALIPEWKSVRFGVSASIANDPSATGYFYYDDLVMGATDWPSGLQTSTPAADVSAGTWTPSTGTTIYTMLDETIPSDTDYAMSSSSPVAADETRVRMTSVSDPAVGTGHTVSYRYLKDVAAGDRIDLTTTLYTASGNTAIQSWTHTNIGTAGVTATQVLGTAAADLIPAADYTTGLVVGFSAIKV